jgi:hypothetical protein
VALKISISRVALLSEEADINECGKGDLRYEDKGNPVSELGVKGLMVPSLHPQPCPDAPAQYRHPDQS